jgi:hypothetical protein
MRLQLEGGASQQLQSQPAGGRHSCAGRSGRSSHSQDAAFRIRTQLVEHRRLAGQVEEVRVAGTSCDSSACRQTRIARGRSADAEQQPIRCSFCTARLQIRCMQPWQVASPGVQIERIWTAAPLRTRAGLDGRQACRLASVDCGAPDADLGAKPHRCAGDGNCRCRGWCGAVDGP